jgi:LuxR family maltose regulon positive regulatory protein
MATPFLSIKFFIPKPRKALVRREHLYDILNKSIRCKLILVSAPAGYGKTTLITSWLKDQALPIAWVSADAGDNDFYRFFSYLLEALHRRDLCTGETLLQMLQSSSPPSEDNLVELVLNEISTLTEDCFLVIDDYHLIQNPVIHSAFSQIIASSPKELHFIICSRTELPFSVSRLRASDELLEITQRDLCLTLDESTSYMNLMMGAELQPDDIAILQDRTEGWLVGLQLAALSLHDLPDPVAFIHSLKGDNRYIGDYLVDEVLMLIPADLQHFLLRSSILTQMEASLCNYVLQIENSQELLETVDKQRLFIIPLDDNRQWFRYHHLFREMLYARMLRRSPETVAVLNQRASAWHAEHGTKEEAVGYALDGNDFTKAAVLIKEIGLSILSHGGWNQLLNWYGRIPEIEFHRYPDLWLTYFMTVINAGLITDAAQKIEGINSIDLNELGLSNEELIRTRGELASVQGVINLHSRADPSKAKEFTKVARECLTADSDFGWAFANNNYGVSCLLLGEIEEARETFEKTIAWAKTTKFSLSIVMGTSHLAEATAMAGNLRTAEELFREVNRYVHEMGLQQGAVFSKANLGLGSLYYEWNRPSEALLYLTEGVRLAEQGGYLDQLLSGCAALARLQNLQGDLAGVQGTIQRAKRLADKYGDPPAAVSFISALEADMAQQRGALHIVDNWLAYGQKSSSNPTNIFSQYEQVALARVLGAKEDYSAMRTVIKPIWELALRQGHVRAAISYDVIMARCLFMSGEPLAAMAILKSALFKAEPNHFVRSFLDEGGVVVSMIKQLLASGKDKNPSSEECSTEYLYFLLDEVAKDTLKASTSLPLSRTVAGSDPLTDHELHILDMLEAGYPNKQIAQELNISLNTVKYHLKNIYGKLGVVNRTQAARMVRKEEQ